jgi:hypothetical protein
MPLMAQIDHWELVLDASDPCQFFPGLSEPDPDWPESGFDDSAWPVGPGGVGYGDGDDGVTIPGLISTYLRYDFVLQDTADLESLILSADFDDGFVAYLNGKELCRSQMWGDRPAFDAFATAEHEASIYQGLIPDAFVFNKRSLSEYWLPDSNVLAVQVHNWDASSSDLSSNFYIHVALDNPAVLYRPVKSWFYPELHLFESDLPLVVIQTPQFIVDEPKVSSQMQIIQDDDGYQSLLDPATAYFGHIGIEQRGSSSFYFPKRSFGLETREADSSNRNVSILGMPTENDWVLYAPYSDKSLLRNVMLFDLGRAMGHWAPRTRFVELFENGDYQGVYVLMESIKRDDDRVDIAAIDPTIISGIGLTGGYLIKIDKTTGSSYPGWYSDISPDLYYQFHDPKYPEMNEFQRNYIQGHIRDFEELMLSPSFNDPLNGYLNWIDVGSFVDYFIANEWSRNVDGYRLSSFLYKDRDDIDGRLYAGPLWDFNLAFGNANYCEGSEITGYQFLFDEYCPDDPFDIPFWWKRLLSDQGFQNRLKCRWRQLREGYLHDDSISSRIQAWTDTLDIAKQRNFANWPVLGTWLWPNNFVGSTYVEEIDYLETWVLDRAAWLDENLPGFCRFQENQTAGPGTTGIDPGDYNYQLDFWPNPSADVLFLHLSPVPQEDLDLRMTDVSGRTVWQGRLSEQSLSGNAFRMRLENLPEGMLFLDIRRDGVLVAPTQLILHH